jgi:hypothetical protein
MALIECPECHKEVSDKADACPHCGNPIAATKNEKPKDKSRRGCLVFILLLIGVAVLLSIIGGHEKTGEHEEIGEKGEKPTSASNAPETPEERKTEQATKPVPEPSTDVVRCYLAYFDAFGLFLEGWGSVKLYQMDRSITINMTAGLNRGVVSYLKRGIFIYPLIRLYDFATQPEWVIFLHQKLMPLGSGLLVHGKKPRVQLLQMKFSKI